MTQKSNFMREAIVLAQKSRIKAPPNPWVGCVIERDGWIVGSGSTAIAGGPHAEVNALHSAGDLAKGATAYVTLEPCSHHGRTPPCAEALIKAGVAKVLVGIEDPDPKVQGKGLRMLREAGIEVETGLLATEIREQLEPYLHHRRSKVPFCCLKTALSLDGRTAAADSTSQWITGPDARANAHQLRAESQAILIGSGTAIQDQPRLTVRKTSESPPHPPLRILLDRRGRVPASGPLFDTSIAPTLVVTSTETDDRRMQEWHSCGAETLVLGRSNQDLKDLLQHLGRRGILQLMVEGGPEVHGAFLSQGLCDQLSIYFGNCLLGPTGKVAFPTPLIHSMLEAPRYQLKTFTPLGQDIRLDYRPLK